MPAAGRRRGFSLRLQAYRQSLQPSDAARRPEHFDCADCLPPPARRVGLTRDPAKQARRLCVLPSFDTSAHPAAPVVKRVWMGRARDYTREGKDPDWAAPNEPIADMGCPGAWYRTAWCRSLDRYYRRRDEHGNRIDRPALTQCTDPLVLEAIETLEAYEDAAHAEASRLHYAEQARKQKVGRP